MNAHFKLWSATFPNANVSASRVSYLPVKVITDVFKVGEKRHWAEEARQLIPCHRGEAAVFKGTADRKAQRKCHYKRWLRKEFPQASTQSQTVLLPCVGFENATHSNNLLFCFCFVKLRAAFHSHFQHVTKDQQGLFSIADDLWTHRGQRGRSMDSDHGCSCVYTILVRSCVCLHVFDWSAVSALRSKRHSTPGIYI